MTHKNIYDKFLIEYDKANVTSSYPSFTKVEIAAILNKAYLALISQKFTGNNVRKVGFGQDGKALVDLLNLISEFTVSGVSILSGGQYDNSVFIKLLHNEILYFISVVCRFEAGTRDCVIIPPQLASRYGYTIDNKPIIKAPACYIEGDVLKILYDSRSNEKPSSVQVHFIKPPVEFTLATIEDNTTNFELNDQVAEELISLAVTFALENIESPRLAQKINTLQLEA